MVAVEAERRRFTLFDAMVLIAATAIGMAVSRAFLRALPAYAGKGSLPRYQVAAASPCLAAWTLALLALRRRPPHPRPTPPPPRGRRPCPPSDGLLRPPAPGPSPSCPASRPAMRPSSGRSSPSR